MSVTFRIAKHSIRPDVQLVEVLLNGNVVAVIYPKQAEDGINIVSAHIFGKVTEDNGEDSVPPIPSVGMNFRPRKYAIVNGKISYEEESLKGKAGK